jgi:hypothetical protein
MKLPNQSRIVLLLAMCVCVGFVAIVVEAQSGRKTPKRPDPLPEESPSPSPTKKPEPEVPRVPLTVGINGSSGFSYLPNYFYDSALASCAERLREARSASVHVTGREMTRSDAVRIAKSQTDGFVVLLELKVDNMGAASSGQNISYEDLQLEYTVFGPEQGKVVTFGHTYPSAYRKGSIVALPTSRNSTVLAETLVKEAAKDAGSRILAALHLVLPASTAPGP